MLKLLWAVRMTLATEYLNDYIEVRDAANVLITLVKYSHLPPEVKERMMVELRRIDKALELNIRRRD